MRFNQNYFEIIQNSRKNIADTEVKESFFQPPLTT